MRVLLLVHRFLPKHVGGAEITAYEVALALSRVHDVCVAYPEQVSMPSYESWDVQQDVVGDLPVWRLQCAPPNLQDPAARHNIFNPGGVNALRACLDEFRPDVVHVHSLGRLSAGAIWEIKARGIPVVITLHDCWFLCTRYHLVNIDGGLCGGPCAGQQCLLSECFDHIADRFDPFDETGTSPHSGVPAGDGSAHRTKEGETWRRLRALPGPLRAAVPAWVKARARRHSAPQPDPRQAPVPTPLWLPRFRYQAMLETIGEADLLVSPSHFLRDRFLAHGVAADSIRLLANGIPSSRFGGVGKRPHDTLTFGYLGSLDPKKGVHDLVAAFNQMSPAEAWCVIAGSFDNPYGQRLKEFSANPSVSFAGALSPAQVPAFYEEIDVLVLPSLCYENSPVTIHEAYYTRTPVIAVDAGGMAELVEHERTGFLYRRGDPLDLRQCIRRFIDDSSLVERFAQQLPRQETVDEVVATLEEWYGYLVGGG